MITLNHLFTDFRRGEVSPRVEGQITSEEYAVSCRTIENMIVPLSAGGERRPGTVYAGAAKNTDKVCRLIPFQDGDDETFVLEFGNTYLRVWKGSTHTQVLSGANPLEILIAAADPPWTEDALFEIRVAQAIDTMYIVHPSFTPHKLVKAAGDTSWTLTAPAFGGAPPWGTDYPAAVTFMDDRLIFGWGQGIFGSVTATYEDFAGAGTYEHWNTAEKIYFARWIIDRNGELIIGGSNTEIVLTGNGSPITDENQHFKRQSTYGSAKVSGIFANEAVIYAQKGCKRLRELIYVEDWNGYRSPDLTRLAEHIFGSGIKDMVFQRIPDSIIWCVRSDGQLAALTYNKEGNIIAWHRHVTDGAVESAAVIDTANEDEIWVSVKRVIGDVDKRYIEYFKPRDFGTDQADCFFVDSGITVDCGDPEVITEITKSATCEITFAAVTGFANDDLVKITGVTDMPEVNGNIYMLKNKAANTFDLYLSDGSTQIDSSAFTAAADDGSGQKMVDSVDGLTHLEGKTVAVLADGAAHPDCVVDTGAIDLARYAVKIHVGLPYISTLKPQRFPQSPDKLKRIDHLTLRFYKTLGCKVGPDADNLEIMSFRSGGDPMDSPPSLYTGDKQVPFRGKYEKGGDIMIIQDQPLPLVVLAIIPEAIVYEG